MSKVISFINNKGGVAKSTTVYQLAPFFAVNYKILIIDSDQQGNLSSMFVNEEELPTYKTIAALYDFEDPKLTEEKIRLTIHETKYDNIDLMPANLNLGLYKFNMINLHKREERMKIATNVFKEEYDFILIDNPPELDMIVTNNLLASDYVIVPVTTKKWSLTGLRNVWRYLDNIKDLHQIDFELLGILINKHDKRLNSSKTIKEHLHVKYKDLVLKTIISESTAIEKSAIYKEFIYNLDKKQRSYKQYYDLANEILKRIGMNEIKRARSLQRN